MASKQPETRGVVFADIKASFGVWTSRGDFFTLGWFKSFLDEIFAMTKKRGHADAAFLFHALVKIFECFMSQLEKVTVGDGVARKSEIQLTPTKVQKISVQIGNIPNPSNFLDFTLPSIEGHLLSGPDCGCLGAILILIGNIGERTDEAFLKRTGVKQAAIDEAAKALEIANNILKKGQELGLSVSRLLVATQENKVLAVQGSAGVDETAMQKYVEAQLIKFAAQGAGTLAVPGKTYEDIIAAATVAGAKAGEKVAEETAKKFVEVTVNPRMEKHEAELKRMKEKMDQVEQDSRSALEKIKELKRQRMEKEKAAEAANRSDVDELVEKTLGVNVGDD